MKHVAMTIGLAIAQAFSLSAFAQDSTAVTQADRKQEARGTARSHPVGEGQPVPEAKPRVSKDQRQVAHQDRKAAGRVAARQPHLGEGNPLPEPHAKVAKTDRKEARAVRKTETARANKAGEITSRGEASN